MARYFGKTYTNRGTESNPVWQAVGGGSGGGSGGGAEVYDSGWITCSTSTSGIGKYMDFNHSLGEQPHNITVLLSGSASGADAWEAHHIVLDTNNNNVFGYQAAEIGNSTMRIWMSTYGVQEHKGAAWSGDGSSNGATTHQWGSGNAAYVRVIAAGGGGTWSSGWVNTDGTTAVADGATLDFAHNLGTDNLVIEAYYADDASGTNAKRLHHAIYTGGIDGGGATTEAEGYEITAITSSNITIQLGSNGIWTSLNSSGNTTTNQGNQTSYTGKYIKLVAK